MMRNSIGLALAALLATACSSQEGDDGPNPFLEDQEVGKGDTGYMNLAGVEIHATLEADIEAPDYRVLSSPPDLAQFAVTYLRKRFEFYLEIVAEDATAPERVEWLVDGAWITAAEARGVDPAKLTHFRMRQVNAVVLNHTFTALRAGQTFAAKVPRRPYSVMTDAGDTCADENSHISLDNGVYWYLWNPDHAGCKADVQDMTVLVDEVLPNNPASYPEYDKLWEDGKITAVVLFGKLDDEGDIQKDYNWGNADRFVAWLKQAGFAEVQGAPIGKRFEKTVGQLTEIVDVYYPDAYHSVTDYAHFQNWQTAVSEHEIVVYLGHSVLGSGSAYGEVEYPDFYQIFLIGGCLGYEYYVRPVLAGKGGWENVDAISSIVENYYSELNGVTGAFLAKLYWGAEHEGKASWQEIMAAINNRLGHAHFGVSGARGNCFSPEGNRCETPAPGAQRYESSGPVEIPDDDPAGVTSTIEVPDELTIGKLHVELDVTHTYAGDLRIVVEHGGVEHVLWANAGGAQDDIEASIEVDVFAGASAAGPWTLKVVDSAAQDAGTLDRWALVVTAP